jgi:hypothetical protein
MERGKGFDFGGGIRYLGCGGSKLKVQTSSAKNFMMDDRVLEAYLGILA